MRLLHVIPTYLPAVRYGGPIFSTHALCRELVGRGHEVHVCTTNVDGPGTSDVPVAVPVGLDGVVIRYFPSTTLRRLYFSMPMARWLAASIATYDVVHIHSMFTWTTLCAARLAHGSRVPYVLSPRGSLVPELIRRKSRAVKLLWLQAFDRTNLSRAAVLQAMTETEAAHLRGFGWSLPDIVIVPNGIQVAPSVGRPPAEDAGTVLFLGRLSWEKGIDRLLAAIVHVPGARLVIAGNDETNYSAALSELAARYGVTERVTFVGPAYGDAKEDLLQRAALVVLPSLSENFGNVVLEAWAQSRAVVVTPGVGLAGVVSKSGGGAVSQGDPESLGGTIRDLLANPERRMQMGRAGRTLVEREYSWSSVAGQMETYYRGVKKGAM